MRSVILMFTILLILINVNVSAANRYWVGGSGTWNLTSSWSATSGGASGATVPLNTDDVFFDVNSGITATSIITMPDNSTSTCKNMLFNTGVIGYNIVGGLTARLDINGSATLEPSMNFFQWRGPWYFYQSTTGVNNTFTTANNTFVNTLVRFELPSAGVGGNLDVIGDFNFAATSSTWAIRTVEVNLQNKANTVTFNGVCNFPYYVDIIKGTVNTVSGFNMPTNSVPTGTISGLSQQFGFNNQSHFLVKEDGILNNDGDVTASVLAIRGEVYMNASNSATGNYIDLLMPSSHSLNGAYPYIFDFNSCTVNIRSRFIFGGERNCDNANRNINAANSTLQFASTATSHYLSNHTFNNYHILNSNNTFSLVVYGYIANNEPIIDSLIADRNTYFGVYTSDVGGTNRRGYPQITGYQEFTAGHRYSMDRIRASLHMINSADVVMVGDCENPVELVHFNHDMTNVGTITADHLVFLGVNEAVPATYNPGANSRVVTGATITGWTIPAALPARTLVWTGPNPTDISDETTYGNWYSETHWCDVTANPTWTSDANIAPGNPGYCGIVCPPTEIDSVIFPNNSYVTCDKTTMYTEGMNWLGDGRIFAGVNRDLQIWGSLHLSPSMINDFGGTVLFRSNRTYRCFIETNNQPFDYGVVFNSQNTSGEWLLLDSLLVPNQDNGASAVGNTNVSLAIMSGHLYTGTASCTLGNGEFIEAFGLVQSGGEFSAFDSDILINGYASGNNIKNLFFAGGTFNCGTSHIMLRNEQNSSGFGGINSAFPKADLGNKTFYDVSTLKPTKNTPNNFSHLVAVNPNTKVRLLTLGANTFPVIQSSATATNLPYFQKIDGITSDLVSFKSGFNTNPNIYDAAKNIAADTVILNGNSVWGISAKINSYLELESGSTNQLGNATVSSSIELMDVVTFVSPYLNSCPGGSTVVYPGATMNIDGSCASGNTNITWGQFEASTTLPVITSYLTLNNNIVVGANVPFITNNSLLINVTTGWLGTPSTPRKLRWVDPSSLAGNTGSWQDQNYWEQVYPTYAAAPQCPPTRIDTVLFDATSFSANNQNVQLTGLTDIASMYWENIPAVNNPTLLGAAVQVLTIRASVHFHPNMNNNHNGPVYFTGTPTATFPVFTIDAGEIDFNRGIYFTGQTDTTCWSFLDSVATTGTNGAMILNRGKIITNGHNLNIESFLSNGNNIRSLDMQNSTVILRHTIGTGLSYDWKIDGPVANGTVVPFTLEAAGSTISCIAGTSNTKDRLLLGGKSYENIITNSSQQTILEPNGFRRDSVVYFEANGPAPLNNNVINVDSIFIGTAVLNADFTINSQGGQYDSLIFNNDGNIQTSNKINSFMRFSPSKNYNLTANSVQWVDNAAVVDLDGGSSAGVIQFYGIPTGQQAYIRKDSGYFCADYVNIRDVWAVGNGDDAPGSCTSYATSGVNTICTDSNPWINSSCDTITDLNSTCGPWTSLPADANRGRADFNAGNFADLQGGNVWGWDKRTYAVDPIINLTSYNDTICEGEYRVLSFQGVANLPFDVFYYENGTQVFVNIDSVQQLQSYDASTGDYVFFDTVTPVVTTTYNLGFVVIDRCFNNTSATGIGVVEIVVNPAPSISSIVPLNDTVCINQSITMSVIATSGSTVSVFADSTILTPIFSGASGAGTMSYTSGVITTDSIFYLGATSNLGCPSLARLPDSIWVSPLPIITAITVDTVCSSSSFSITATSADNINWYATATGGSAIATTSTYSNTLNTTTSFYAQAITSFGCVNEPRVSSEVFVHTIPASPGVTSPLNVCVGSNINLVSTGGTGDFAWSGPNSYSSALQNPTITNGASTMSGNYIVTETVNNCTSNPATIVVSVTTCPPVANNDVDTISEDGLNSVIDILDNDTDIDGIPSAPTNNPGQYTVDLDPIAPGNQTTFTDVTGTWTYDPTTGEVTFDPVNDYNGNASIIYVLTDPEGNTDTATITVTVEPVNDAPIIDNENHTIPEDTQASGDLTDAGDSDVDGNLVVTVMPIDGPNSGAIVINPDGTYTYTPNQHFNGLDTVVVQICDDGTPIPIICVNDTIFITVSPVNDFPSQGNENLTGVVEDDLTSTTSPNLTTNNIDPDGTDTEVTIILSTTGGGTVTINPSGDDVEYTPFPGFNGVDTVIYTVCDNGLPLPVECVNDTLFVTVNPVNDAPSQGNESMGPVVEDETTPATSPNLTTNNIDPDGTDTEVTVIVSSTGGGTVSINPNGDDVNYTPSPNFNGVDTVIYTVCDNGLPLPGLCVNDTLFVTISPVNDPPIVDNEFISVPVNGSNGGDLTDAGDIDIDGNLVVNTAPVDGPDFGGIVINPDGTFTYTPNPGYVGNDTVVVVICDDGTPTPIICVNDTIFITVLPTTPPVASPDSTVTNEDVAVTLNVTGDDTDVDGTIDDGTVDLDPGTVGVQTTFTSPEGTWTVDSNGDVTFTPNQDYNGDATITYTVNDDDGATSNTATLTVTVVPVNDPPLIDNENDTTQEDIAVSGDVTDAGDSDVDGSLVVNTIPIDDPNNGTIVINPDGTYTYTPNTNFNGVDTVVVVICDDGTPTPIICINDTIFITVTPVNDPPVNGNETVLTSEDTPVPGIDVVANNTDPEGDSVVVSFPNGNIGSGGGTFTDNGDGTVDYTPVPGFTGTDTLIYVVCDTVIPPGCVNDTIFVIVSPCDVAVATDDCDNDGLNNGEETTGIDDPNTPDTPNGNTSDPLNPDTDGDGVTDNLEGNDGTDPNDPCDLILASQNVTPLPLWWLTDCDMDGLTNEEEITGVDDPGTTDTPNGEITDPFNPDTDGDGVVDGTEGTDGTDPNDPCDLVFANITVAQTGDWLTADCDGDGVSNGAEVADMTNPNNPCEFELLSQILPVGLGWLTADCDSDGLTNEEETTGVDDPNTPDTPNGETTDPLNPDSDGDGVVDGTEGTDGTDPNNPCDLVIANITSVQGGGWNAADCDGDGVTNEDEINGPDGDPLTAGDNTEPYDPCDYDSLSITLPQGGLWNTADCDNDGLTNEEEVTGIDDPSTPDVPNGNETDPFNEDTDGDGVVDGTEGTDGTDPNNPCDFDESNITVTITALPCELNIPDAFSPNGDGVNDMFFITGIENYPNSNFMILNRWGNKVYESTGYQNDWDGINQFGISVGGDVLPVGTYFYILDLGTDADDADRIFKGYIYLTR